MDTIPKTPTEWTALSAKDRRETRRTMAILLLYALVPAHISTNLPHGAFPPAIAPADIPVIPPAAITPPGYVPGPGTTPHPSPPPPVKQSWKPRFSNLRWSATVGSWTGSGWLTGGGLGGTHLDLTAIGTWAIGFRPTKARVTFTRTQYVTLQIYDANMIYQNTTYNSAVEATLTFATDDIDNLSISVGEVPFDPFTITNIEFLV